MLKLRFQSGKELHIDIFTSLSGKRLFLVIYYTGMFFSFSPVTPVYRRSYHNHKDILPGWKLFQPGKKIPAIDPRHVDIKKDQDVRFPASPGNVFKSLPCIKKILNIGREGTSFDKELMKKQYYSIVINNNNV